MPARTSAGTFAHAWSGGRSSARPLAFLAVLMWCLVAAGCAALASADPPPSPEEREMLAMVNEVRATGAACGTIPYPAVAALSWNDRLARAARKHSEDMEAAGELAHVTPVGSVHFAPGTTPAGRVELEGYTYATMGENVAFGTTSPEDVMDLWMASPGHCRNLLNPDFREIGVGRSGVYWTQNFGAMP